MLLSKLKVLKPHQVKELHATMTEASVVFELGGSANDVFKKAKHRKVGAIRAIYESLEKLKKEDLDKVSKNMSAM
jgi:hypothetical protein